MPYSRSEALNPRLINIFSYALWSFPISYALVLGTVYNLPIPKVFHLVFSFVYVTHAVIAVGTGLALYYMKPFAWHLFVFHSVIMQAEQFYVAYRHAENHVVEIPLALMSMTIVTAVILLKLELRVPYYNPRIAWWESDPRYRISVPAEMTYADHFYKGEIMDISASGCFVKTKESLRVDQELQIKFCLFEQQFDCLGKVVWRTESGVTHPKGVGVRFLRMSKPVYIDLRSTVKKLRKLSRRFKTLRNEEKISKIEEIVEALLQQRKS